MARPESLDDQALPRWEGIQTFEGDPNATGLRIALVVSRYNLRHTSRLLHGAIETLLDRGARPEDLKIIWVPGAYEIPTAVEAVAVRGEADAICALGCVIEGETPHATLINTTVASALSEIARRYLIPVIDAVVPARTEEQAEARCRPGATNRGAYAARAAIEMARLMGRLKDRPQ